MVSRSVPTTLYGPGPSRPGSPPKTVRAMAPKVPMQTVRSCRFPPLTQKDYVLLKTQSEVIAGLLVSFLAIKDLKCSYEPSKQNTYSRPVQMRKSNQPHEARRILPRRIMESPSSTLRLNHSQDISTIDSFQDSLPNEALHTTSKPRWVLILSPSDSSAPMSRA